MAKILMVDDEADMLDVWSLYLRDFGHDVMKAINGIEALDIAQKTPPDLVILDLMMPNASGEMVLGIIRNTPSLQDTRVLVVSAHPKGAQLAESFDADGFLEKPVDAEQFQAEVSRLIQ